MSTRYVYDHAWTQERIRLAGLETALDPGTFEHLTRLGVSRGWRCLEVGGGGGSVASWLSERVGPDGEVIATDLETDFLESVAISRTPFTILKHDLMTQALPAGFDLVHARYVVEWLPDKRLGLERMAAALRPGGVLVDEEPDFVTMFYASEPPSLRNAILAAMRYLEASCAVDTQYGRRVLNDITSTGLVNTAAEGRCPVVRGGSPPAAHFLALTLQKLRTPLLTRQRLSEAEFDEAIAALENPAICVYMPMTIAAWGWRAN
jgi:2-polyprenyl-3-methyl-5-hydroxy-6-metoxy-1,4-benzoquinol methylase